MIEDERLKFYVESMSQVMALQAVLKVAKQNGYYDDRLDGYLVFLNDLSQMILLLMNRRLKEIGNYD